MLEPTGHFKQINDGPRLSAALAVSICLHAALFFFVLPELLPRPETEHLLELRCPGFCQPPDDMEPIAYDLIIQPEPEWLAEVERIRQEQEPEPTEEPPEEPEPPPEPDRERAEPEPVPEQFYMVHLQTDDEDDPPVDTIYLAPVNSRTDIEVQAELTTLLDAEPGQEPDADTPTGNQIPDPESERARDARDERNEASEPHAEPNVEIEIAVAPSPEIEETIEQTGDAGALARSEPAEPTDRVRDPNRLHEGPRERLDLSAFSPTMRSYQRSPIAARDRQHHQRISRQMRYEGFLYQDDQAEWERTRATLENMVPEVRTGTETRLNARRHQYAGYISHVHRRIHALWAHGYLMSLDLRFDLTDPQSNRTLETVLEIVVDASGDIARVNIVRTSGVTAYDGEAVSIVHQIGPLRAPPAAILSDNGNAYIHWTFWRDQRQCGTFGASVHRVR